MTRPEIFVHKGVEPQDIFPSIDETAHFLSRRLSMTWHLTKVVGICIKAEMAETDAKHGLVKISANGRQISRIPRRSSMIHEGVVIQKGSSLVARIASNDDPLIVAGRTWITAAGLYDSLMSLTIHEEHGMEEDEIANQLTVAFARGDQFVGGLLEGEISPPYSGYFVGTPLFDRE